MDNIFKDAKFGDKFITRDGKLAIFDRYCEYIKAYRLLVEGDGMEFYSKHGDHQADQYTDESLDIVSKYE